MKTASYAQICMSMLRTGLLGYGGGPSTIPLLRHEAVERNQWLSGEEFGEVLAIANALPGPIATKLAAYLGYRQKRWSGACVAVLAHILPTCLAMVIFVSAISTFSGSRVVQGMIAAVVPVVAVMLATMAYEFGEKAVKGLGLAFGAACIVLSFVLLELLRFHPAGVIVLFLAYGAVHSRIAALWRKARARAGKEKDAHWNG